MTFLLRVETISEICEELKLVRRDVRRRSSGIAHEKPFVEATYVHAMSAFQREISVSGQLQPLGAPEREVCFAPPNGHRQLAAARS